MNPCPTAGTIAGVAMGLVLGVVGLLFLAGVLGCYGIYKWIRKD